MPCAIMPLLNNFHLVQSKTAHHLVATTHWSVARYRPLRPFSLEKSVHGTALYVFGTGSASPCPNW